MHSILIVEGNLPNENKNFQSSGIQTHAESLKESLSYYSKDLKIDKPQGPAPIIATFFI